MTGMRPFTIAERDDILAGVDTGKWGRRNKVLIALGCFAGYRISELLSLSVGQVWQDGGPRNYLTVPRKKRKGKTKSLTIRLHGVARDAISAWIAEYTDDAAAPLFPSRGGGRVADGAKRTGRLSRRSAIHIVQHIARECGIDGPIGCHSMRKCFAHNIHRLANGNVVPVRELLGHANLSSTGSYLAADSNELDELVLNQ